MTNNIHNAQLAPEIGRIFRIMAHQKFSMEEELKRCLGSAIRSLPFRCL